MKVGSSKNGRGQRATKPNDSDLNANFVRWAASVPAAPKIVTLANGVKLENDLIVYILLLAIRQRASFFAALDFIIGSEPVAEVITEMSNCDEPIPDIYGSVFAATKGKE